jgi:hypothetical protein
MAHVKILLYAILKYYKMNAKYFILDLFFEFFELFLFLRELGVEHLISDCFINFDDTNVINIGFMHDDFTWMIANKINF